MKYLIITSKLKTERSFFSASLPYNSFLILGLQKTPHHYLTRACLKKLFNQHLKKWNINLKINNCGHSRKTSDGTLRKSPC